MSPARQMMIGIMILLSYVNFCSAEPVQDLNPCGARTITGKVIEVRQFCQVDGPCDFTVRTQDRDIFVSWGGGWTHECGNLPQIKDTGILWSIKKDDTVEVYAAVSGAAENCPKGNQYSLRLCGSPEFYVKILD